MKYNLKQVEKDIIEYKGLKDEINAIRSKARQEVVEGRKNVVSFVNLEFEMYRSLESKPIRSRILEYGEEASKDTEFELEFRRLWVKEYWGIVL